MRPVYDPAVRLRKAILEIRHARAMRGVAQRQSFARRRNP
jgi:hypothetical protein